MTPKGRDAVQAAPAVGVEPGVEPVPASGSGVRAAAAAPPSRPSKRRNTPPLRQLTPYQARLDVEMDDTAISKVRDPSVSIALGADSALVREAQARRRTEYEPALSIAAGVVLGALVVVLIVFAMRAFGF